MSYYCADGGKRVFCDKSLDTHEHLDAVIDVFPDVKIIFVVRHVMDTIVSGIEASPWGFGAYGYTSYVRNSPENFVAALAAYWERLASVAAQWESDRPNACIRVRYEDLVTNPAHTLARVFEFIGVPADGGVVNRHFAQQPPTLGPGDHKIDYTTSVSAQSVGRGKRVPIAMIPPPLVERLSSLLEGFGYPALTDTWNSTPLDSSTVDARDADQLGAFMDHLVVSAPDWVDDIETFAVIADDAPTLRWIIEPGRATVRRGDGDVDFILTGATRDLVALLAGGENVGTMLRCGRVRCVAADGPGDAVEVGRAVRAMTAVLLAGERAAPTAGN
jgi:hypothetical protein